ncbi:MAG: hypothetical protein OHK0029_06710 [Armatimonadaceae bacterium]
MNQIPSAVAGDLTTAAVGTIAPEFTLTDPVTGKTIQLSDFRGRDVLLIFLRGTWCPFCRQQLETLKANRDEIARANITVLTVACQNGAMLRRYAEKHELPFPLLPDESRAVAKSYGTHYWLTWEGFNLSHPALFILDRDGRISFAYVGKNMRDLPLPTVLGRFLKFLQEANDKADAGAADPKASPAA